MYVCLYEPTQRIVLLYLRMAKGEASCFMPLGLQEVLLLKRYTLHLACSGAQDRSSVCLREVWTVSVSRSSCSALQRYLMWRCSFPPFAPKTGERSLLFTFDHRDAYLIYYCCQVHDMSGELHVIYPILNNLRKRLIVHAAADASLENQPMNPVCRKCG